MINYYFDTNYMKIEIFILYKQLAVSKEVIIIINYDLLIHNLQIGTTNFRRRRAILKE